MSLLNPYRFFHVPGWGVTTAGLTLSSDRTTGTTTGTGASGAMSVTHNTTGKRYFEVVMTWANGTGSEPDFGVASSNSSLTATGVSIGGTQYTIDRNTSGLTAIVVNGSQGGFLNPRWVSGDVCGVCIDFSTGRVWYMKNGASLYGGNPAAGTSPDATLTPNADLYAYWRHISEIGASGTLHEMLSQFVYAPPTGFTAWTV